MNTQQLIDEGYLTPQGQPTQKLTQTLADGIKWRNYYTGEYTIIRRDKLAMLNNSHKTLKALQIPQQETCPTCGTPLKQMPCDDFKYCPKCDLPPC